MRRCLSQAGWAVSTKKENDLTAFYRRVAARRGSKRAVIAVAHQLLVIAYHLLKRKEEYRDLGANHFDNINADRVRRSLVRLWSAWVTRSHFSPSLRQRSLFSQESIFVGVWTRHARVRAPQTLK